MNLPEISIRKPVTTTILMSAILLCGFLGYGTLPVSDLPNVDFPTIQVNASLPGANPETMASAIATPLERQFTTIEGLATADGKLHPVQQAVAEGQAFQCAFCMSGFIMATVGFLNKKPSPTRAELAHGISGNLCRCADYNKILDAMMHASEMMRKA